MIGELFGIKIFESTAVPPNAVLLVSERVIQDAVTSFWQRGIIEVEPMEPGELLRIVLGPTPDWIKEP